AEPPRATEITPLAYTAGMSTLHPPAAAGEPNWIADGARQVRDEIALFLVTLRDFTLRPGRFAAEWADGSRRALNPIAFLLNSLAVVFPYSLIWKHVLGRTTAEAPFWLDLVKPLVYVATNLLVATLCHAFLRLGGRIRRVRSS